MALGMTGMSCDNAVPADTAWLWSMCPHPHKPLTVFDGVCEMCWRREPQPRGVRQTPSCCSSSAASGGLICRARFTMGHPQNPRNRLEAGCRPSEAAPHPLLPPHLSLLPAQPPAAARQPALAAQARKSACKGTDMYVLHVGGTITTTVVWQTPNHSSMCVAE